jgi:cold shock CspA family protein
MTGKIMILSTMSPSGFIRADSGQNVYFHSSAVVPPGAGGLFTGQLVTFDLDGGKWPAAINVRVPGQDQAAPPQAAEKEPEGTYLQYLGFEQTGNIRAYRFGRIARGEETREFIVSADMALFAKHHVGIQEGPALSLGRLRLSARADASGAPASVLSQCLTDSDMVAHLARRSAPVKSHGRKRTPDASASAASSA